MDIKEKITALMQRKKEIDKEIYQSKTEFKQYITNSEIPVLERWEFFTLAPREFKEQSNYIIRPNNSFLKSFMDNRFDAPEIYGRGKTIYFGDMFEDLVDGDELNEEDYYYKKFGEKVIKEGLEELLEMNLEYFCLDW